MRIGIVAVGRLKSGPERALVERYSERFGQIGRTLGLPALTLTELPESLARHAPERKAQEATALLAACPEDALILRLDERGRTLPSAEFASQIATERDQGRKNLVFLIGGADGLDPSLANRAPRALAFGAMTLPHQLVRVLLLEQLYRAATILSGHPYHRA
jgi:23S rRNA (pseudouridine1915-N3)-methyltransferase